MIYYFYLYFSKERAKFLVKFTGLTCASLKLPGVDEMYLTT